jgi:hypothetical protein
LRKCLVATQLYVGEKQIYTKVAMLSETNGARNDLGLQGKSVWAACALIKALLDGRFGDEFCTKLKHNNTASLHLVGPQGFL